MTEKAYPKVAEKLLALLTVFPFTRLCQSGFSSIVAAQSRLLDLWSYLRYAIS